MPRFQHLENFFRTLLPYSIRFLFISLVFWTFSTETVLADSIDSSIQAGIADYSQQNYKQAEANFLKALKEQPENPKLNYNLANSHYKNGQFEKALKSYGRVTANQSTPDLKQKSLYNSGNAFFRMGKHEESIAAYKKVLEMNPKDMDAKFNLEFVREQLKKKDQQDQKQNQPQDEDSDDNQNPQQNPPEENSSGDQREDSANQENQEPSSPEKPEQKTDPSSPEQKKSNPSELAQAPENSISKDQAEQWLSGLDEDLKKFSQIQAKKEGGNAPVSSRDW